MSDALRVNTGSNYSYLKVAIHPKLPISQSKFSGSRKYMLEISVVCENRNRNLKKNRKYVKLYSLI